MTKQVPSAADRYTHAPEPDSMDDLRQDCARMSARWTPVGVTPARESVSHSRLHGVRVPERSARMLDGMSDYGD
ncbi:hypothetical protein JGS22_018155 [Streptomyces sp. P38-E01]|uniref:Uncharacterized protein n=1 Tax=Streptomyces tardus TaxID=2780544 RepID=A0A949JIX0_9ACTN|nr:hypothetical protein [Streptomyces tardus]MBU7599490.1 hypothetical protein [Streptomyces tardus]